MVPPPDPPIHREAPRRYGKGRWERKRLYAIAASYYHAGHDAADVAQKLEISETFVAMIFEYFDDTNDAYQARIRA